MENKSLKIVLVSTPIGYIGSGKGGGVELTLISLIKGLLNLGNEIVLIAPYGSKLPSDCKRVEIKHFSGEEQPSWQHQEFSSPVIVPLNGVLPKLWEEALRLGKEADVILNFGYDWLPLWLTTQVEQKIFHLISMGAESKVIKDLINDISKTHHKRLAFHSYNQASDYDLAISPIVVGNGFDLRNYDFSKEYGGPLGWAGRISPEKGLEDAVAVAEKLGESIFVWGLIEDTAYAEQVEKSFPAGTINWRGFLNTLEFQKELGACRALINTPKWNEAYGNVVVESLACGVPVISYNRGGPGELISSGITGWLVEPDSIEELISFTKRVEEIDRTVCREWVEKSASYKVFARRIDCWLREGIHENGIKRS